MSSSRPRVEVAAAGADSVAVQATVASSTYMAYEGYGGYHARSARGSGRWCRYLLALSLVSRRTLLARCCWRTTSSPACARASACSGGTASADRSVARESRKSPKQTIHCSAMPRQPQGSMKALELRWSHVIAGVVGEMVEEESLGCSSPL